LRAKFARILPNEGNINSSTITCNSFDIVGDIAIAKLPGQTRETALALAKAILNRHRNVKTVLAQESKVTGEFRLRRLVCIGGEAKTHTVHKESGCCFSVDVESCYFSPRLSSERLRIANLVQPNEVVVNMFAGVGCFSILIAKRAPTATVFSIDINPNAFAFMKENIRLNRVYNKVTPLLGDAKSIVETRLSACADRVLMPLPEKAYDYLPVAVSALKPSGGWLHVHFFEHATKIEDPVKFVKTKVDSKLGELGVKFNITFVRIVRSVGPNWWQLVADVHVG
jgi:tRNA (guanine37-N1)-methyltransferase